MKKNPIAWIGGLLLIGLIGATYAFVWLACLAQTEGRFIYALDDPYIHLAIAKNLALHGVWGVTEYANTSASSSPLWSFLLALSIRVGGISDLWPLAFGIGCSIAAAILLYWRFLRAGFAVPLAFVSAAAIFAIGPLHTLPFTGMEHCLQILLDLLFAFWLLGTMGRRSVLRDMPIGFALTTLICLCRYESVFLVVVPVLVCLWRRDWRLAAAIGLGPVFAVGGFALYSHFMGMPAIPNSILLKGNLPKPSHVSYGQALLMRTWEFIHARSLTLWDLFVLTVISGAVLRIAATTACSIKGSPTPLTSAGEVGEDEERGRAGRGRENHLRESPHLEPVGEEGRDGSNRTPPPTVRSSPIPPAVGRDEGLAVASTGTALGSNLAGLQVLLWTVVVACVLHSALATVGIFYRYEAYLLVLLATVLILSLRKIWDAPWPKADAVVSQRTWLIAIGVLSAVQIMLSHVFWFYQLNINLLICLVGVGLVALFASEMGSRTLGRLGKVIGGTLVPLAIFIVVRDRAAAAYADISAASRDIYLQQYQMSQFVDRYYHRGRLGANDIGAVTYFTDVHLLDLVGLASDGIRRLKLSHRFSTWTLQQEIDGFKPDLVIAYPDWFAGKEALPKNLIPVARWTIPPVTSAACPSVTFYAPNFRAIQRLDWQLREFQASLPARVKVEYVDSVETSIHL